MTATPNLIVQPVATRRDKKEFLNLPWRIYRDDPNWVPPLRMDQEELVGYRHHPFYEKNEIQTFLARRDGEVCGRIAAMSWRRCVRTLKWSPCLSKWRSRSEGGISRTRRTS